MDVSMPSLSLFSLLKESYCWTPWSPLLSPGKCMSETEISHISSSMKACFICKLRKKKKKRLLRGTGRKELAISIFTLSWMTSKLNNLDAKKQIFTCRSPKPVCYFSLPRSQVTFYLGSSKQFFLTTPHFETFPRTRKNSATAVLLEIAMWYCDCRHNEKQSQMKYLQLFWSKLYTRSGITFFRRSLYQVVPQLSCYNGDLLD